MLSDLPAVETGQRRHDEKGRQQGQRDPVGNRHREKIHGGGKRHGAWKDRQNSELEHRTILRAW